MLPKNVIILTMVAVFTMAGSANGDNGLNAKLDKFTKLSADFIDYDRRLLKTVPSLEVLLTYDKKELVKMIGTLRDVIEINANHLGTVMNVLNAMRRNWR